MEDIALRLGRRRLRQRGTSDEDGGLYGLIVYNFSIRSTRVAFQVLMAVEVDRELREKRIYEVELAVAEYPGPSGDSARN